MTPPLTTAFIDYIGPSTTQQTVAQIQAGVLNRILIARVSVIVVFCSPSSVGLLLDAIYASGLYGAQYVYLFSDSVSASSFTEAPSLSSSSHRFSVMLGSFFNSLSAGMLAFHLECCNSANLGTPFLNLLFHSRLGIIPARAFPFKLSPRVWQRRFDGRR